MPISHSLQTAEISLDCRSFTKKIMSPVFGKRKKKLASRANFSTRKQTLTKLVKQPKTHEVKADVHMNVTDKKL